MITVYWLYLNVLPDGERIRTTAIHAVKPNDHRQTLCGCSVPDDDRIEYDVSYGHNRRAVTCARCKKTYAWRLGHGTEETAEASTEENTSKAAEETSAATA